MVLDKSLTPSQTDSFGAKQMTDSLASGWVERLPVMPGMIAPTSGLPKIDSEGNRGLSDGEKLNATKGMCGFKQEKPNGWREG